MKRYALEGFFKLWRRKQPELAFNQDGLLPPESWSWEEFCATAAAINLKQEALLPDFPQQPSEIVPVAAGAVAAAEPALPLGRLRR